MEVEVDFLPAPGPIVISETRRAELMAEMRQNARDVDPSRETETGNNTDYRMENGLILRLHETETVMWLELLRPATSLSEGSMSLGMVARLQNWRRRGGEEAARRRREVFDLAKSLQPSTAEALAAINKTVEMDLPTIPRAASSAGTRTPASQAPGTPASGTPAPGSRGRLKRLGT